MKNKALIIFSGGQDSTTALGWCIKKYNLIEAITFLYGQKHAVEIEQSKIICKKYNIKQHIIDISFFADIVDSALTSNGNVNTKNKKLKNLPASFVPNRNAMFITIAHSLAQKIEAQTLVTGVCQTDYSGYPDCRNIFIKSIIKTLNLSSDSKIQIKTPLMYLTKTETWQMAEEVNIIQDVIELSHTCYNGNRQIKHDWGYGCNNCPACKLRAKGWEKYINQKT